MAIFPFILVKEAHYKNDKIVINHEKIHLRQQLELGILFFYLWYIIEYLVYLLKVKNRDLAYRSISFEREAYTNERNFEYLENRKFWGFLKYFYDKNS